jgi:acetoacetate decarboxylase
MKIDEVMHHYGTPLVAPPYFLRRARFHDREHFNVLYRTDPEALAKVVPEPLRFDDPLVRFEIMNMGDVAGYGPYVEAGQVIPVTFDGEEGEYLHAMYLDAFGATAAGREMGAYPKRPGKPSLAIEEGALIGRLDFGSERVATATMAYKWEDMDHEEALAQIRTPQFGLRIAPLRSGGFQQFSLMRTQITDVVVKGAWAGPARLQLNAHVMAPLADLPVLEVVNATHVLTDLTLSAFEEVHDYLAEGAPPSEMPGTGVAG